MIFSDTTFETVLIGCITGLLSGAFGVGGGIFCTPVLRLVLNLPAHVAVGTTMALIIPTAIVGVINYLQRKMIDVRLVKLLSIPAVVGTIIGALSTELVHGPLLMILFAGMVSVAGLDLTFSIGKRIVSWKTKSQQDERTGESATVSGKIEERTDGCAAPIAEPSAKPDEQFEKFTPQRSKTAVILGFFVGFFAGFFGVGGGFILVPCLLYFFDVPIKEAFGTSLFVIAIVSLPGTVTHALSGHVDFQLALLMAAGALPCSWLGSLIAVRLKDSILRKCFGLIMLGVAIALAVRELHLFGA